MKGATTSTDGPRGYTEYRSTESLSGLPNAPGLSPNHSSCALLGPPGHVDLEALTHTLSYTPDHFRTAILRLPHESSALLPAKWQTTTDCDATIPKDRGIESWGGLD